MFVVSVFISLHPHGRVVSPHCNVPLRVFTVRRARKHKEALEDSANMYERVPDDAGTEEEINKKISRLQRRRRWSKHKQQLLVKTKHCESRSGHQLRIQFLEFNVRCLTPSRKRRCYPAVCFHKPFTVLTVSGPETKTQPRSKQNATWQALHSRCFTNGTIITSHFNCLNPHIR